MYVPFQVLSLSKAAGFIYPSEAGNGVDGRGHKSSYVPCSDPDIPRGQCYLGRSVYSDGICDGKAVGKINLQQGLIYTVRKGQRQTCPFYMMLVDH